MTSVPDHGWPTDETLIAYADGMLDAEECARIEQYLESNTEARKLVAALRRSGGLAKVAFDEALHNSANERLSEMILGRPSKTSEAPSATIVPFSRRALNASQFGTQGLALAACLTLLLGGIAGYQYGRQQAASTVFHESDIAVGPVASGSSVERLLETSSSGDPVIVQHPGANTVSELTVIGSFRDRQERACREFEATHPGEQGKSVTVAIACRSQSGSWFVEGAARLAAAPPAPDKDFSPAGGASTSAVDGVLSAIGARPAMPAAEERALLERRWK